MEINLFKMGCSNLTFINKNFYCRLWEDYWEMIKAEANSINDIEIIDGKYIAILKSKQNRQFNSVEHF